MKSNIELAHELWAMAQGPQPIGIATVAIADQLDVFADRTRADAEGECKPSLYLFWSAHGGIRYWTRDADAAVRKAIEFGTEPERFYATPVPAPVQPVALAAVERKPLSVGRILSMDIRGTKDEALRFARAIEYAHGIKAQQGGAA